jgi:hypothetical protein
MAAAQRLLELEAALTECKTQLAAARAGLDSSTDRMKFVEKRNLKGIRAMEPPLEVLSKHERRSKRRRMAPPVDPFAVSRGDAKFKAWPALNGDMVLQVKLGVSGPTRRNRVHASMGPLLFSSPSDSLKARFCRALAREMAVTRKEFFETWEFWAQVQLRGKRRRGALRCSECVDTPTFVEIAGGHGLLSALVALHTRRFTRVVVLDKRRPPAFDKVLSALQLVAPEAAARIEYIEADFTAPAASGILPRGCAVACVHGCGSLTDRVVEAAKGGEFGSLAIMPCCYARCNAVKNCPAAIRTALGDSYAADIVRTQQLESAGYSVVWASIPFAITPMNRVLIARRKV